MSSCSDDEEEESMDIAGINLKVRYIQVLQDKRKLGLNKGRFLYTFKFLSLNFSLVTVEREREREWKRRERVCV